MKPKPQRRERAIRPPLPAFLPETPRELAEHLTEYLHYRITAYLSERDTSVARALNTETASIEFTDRSVDTSIAGISHKKRIPEPVDRGMESEHQRLLHERVNEDVIRSGKNWHVLADGVTNMQRNVCGVMGETVTLVADQLISSLEALEHKPDESQVAQWLRGIPTTAHWALLRALQSNTDFSNAQARQHISHGDLSTTVEIVYYASWLQRAFVLHIGDSRTYKVNLDGTAQQLTRDHEGMNSLGQRTVSSTVSTENRVGADVDLHSVPLLPGERIVSLTDGAFANQERGRKTEPGLPDIPTEIGRRAKHYSDLPGFVRSITENGEHMQDIYHFWDDTSVVALERTV